MPKKGLLSLPQLWGAPSHNGQQVCKLNGRGSAVSVVVLDAIEIALINNKMPKLSLRIWGRS